ncbi:hypothetical protein ACFSUD_09660 [Sulfitobacter aestuarii]|uniref:Uncharacterized protein n=1 Tax=Sulfitobacter aestuarii TaxID=2161676 RepID=A0ABW5U1Y9_9RHOB
MSDIEELQRRITAAMDRMARGVDRMAAAPDAETERALEEERIANAQLSERVRVLKARAEEGTAQMGAKVEEDAARMAQLDLELQRLRRANEELTRACAALQAANAEGLADAGLINAAMQAELEALRAARAADVAEASSILGALGPLVEQAASDGADPARTDTEENA